MARSGRKLGGLQPETRPRGLGARQTLVSSGRILVCSGLLAGLASATLGLPARAQGAHPKHKQDYKRQVEKLEEVWRMAQLNGDAEAMDRLLSDDYVGITMNGQVVTKMQQLDRMKTRTLALTKIELDDVKVKLIGSTAVVTSRAEVDGTNDGQPMHGNYRYTRVYTRSPGGAWKITNFEATRVGEPGANGRRPDRPAMDGHPPAQDSEHPQDSAHPQ